MQELKAAEYRTGQPVLPALRVMDRLGDDVGKVTLDKLTESGRVEFDPEHGVLRPVGPIKLHSLTHWQDAITRAKLRSGAALSIAFYRQMLTSQAYMLSFPSDDAVKEHTGLSRSTYNDGHRALTERGWLTDVGLWHPREQRMVRVGEPPPKDAPTAYLLTLGV
ncbi:hypothetical protein [Rhodococcus ruber]